MMRTSLFATLVVFAHVSQTLAQGLPDRNIPGGDYTNFDAPTALACHNSCGGEPRCKAWAWVRPTKRCFLKDRVPNVVVDNCCVSGDIDQETPREMKQETATNRPHSDLRSFASGNPASCEQSCRAEHACSAWSYVHATKQCFLKNRVARPIPDPNVTSGVKYRPRNL